MCQHMNSILIATIEQSKYGGTTLNFPLRMPHERHTRPWRECPPRFVVPAAVGVPVHVGGVDAAIGVDALDDGDVAVVACALRVGLQHDDGGHMWRVRHDPPGGPCSICPLVGVANPVYPVT